MLRQNQFSIASLLGITLCVAIVIRWPHVWLFILIGQIVMALLCVN